MIQIRLGNEAGVTQTLGHTPAIIDRAARSSVLATARRFERALERRIVQELDIPRSAIWRSTKYSRAKPRHDWVRVKSRRVRETGLVWVGYNPIKAGYVGEATPSSWGRLKQFDWGASARSYLFPGAFRARMKSGHRSLFMRRGQGRSILEQVVRVDRVPALARELLGQTAEWHRNEVARQLVQRLARVAGGRVQA